MPHTLWPMLSTIVEEWHPYVGRLLNGLDYEEFNITRLMPSFTALVYAQLLWTIYAYGPDGFAREHVVPCNPNVIGYPFPLNTRVVSSAFPLLFFLLVVSHLFLSLTLLSLNCSPPSKSMRSWYGWLGILSWRWPTIQGACMALEGQPTRAVVVVMMMMVVVMRRIQRWLLATNQGRGVGKSGFVSHTKHIAEVTNMDLFHSWLITCIM